MKIRNVIAAVVLVLISACSMPVKYSRIEPIPDGEQRLVYDDGKEVLVSRKKHIVTLAPKRDVAKQHDAIQYIIYVQNMGEWPFNISSTDIAVTYVDRQKWHSVSRPIHVFSPTEVAIQIERNAIEQEYAADVAAGIGAINSSLAAYGTTTTSSHGTLDGSFGQLNSQRFSGTYTGSSTSTTYDPARAQMLRNQNQQLYSQRLNAISENSEQAMQRLEQLAFKSQTLEPGKRYGGVVITDTKELIQEDVGDFVIIVIVDNEKHVFTVNRSKYIDRTRAE